MLRIEANRVERVLILHPIMHHRDVHDDVLRAKLIQQRADLRAMLALVRLRRPHNLLWGEDLPAVVLERPREDLPVDHPVEVAFVNAAQDVPRGLELLWSASVLGRRE